MLDFMKLRSRRHAPVKPDIDQTPPSPTLDQSDPLASDPNFFEARQARQQYVAGLDQQFRNQVRVIHVSLLLADSNGELGNQLKQDLRNQFLQIAAILEVRDVAA